MEFYTWTFCVLKTDICHAPSIFLLVQCLIQLQKNSRLKLIGLDKLILRPCDSVWEIMIMIICEYYHLRAALYYSCNLIYPWYTK